MNEEHIFYKMPAEWFAEHTGERPKLSLEQFEVSYRIYNDGYTVYGDLYASESGDCFWLVITLNCWENGSEGLYEAERVFRSVPGKEKDIEAML